METLGETERPWPWLPASRYARVAHNLERLEEAAGEVAASTEALADGSGHVSSQLERLRAAVIQGGFGDDARAFARYGFFVWDRVQPSTVIGRDAPLVNVTAARRRLVRRAHRRSLQGKAARDLWSDLRHIYRSAFVLAQAFPRLSAGDPWVSAGAWECLGDELDDLGTEPEKQPLAARCLRLLPPAAVAEEARAWLEPSRASARSAAAAQRGEEAKALLQAPLDRRLVVCKDAVGDILTCVDSLASATDPEVGWQLERLNAAMRILLLLSTSKLREYAIWQRPSPRRALAEQRRDKELQEQSMARIAALIGEPRTLRYQHRGLGVDLWELHEIAGEVRWQIDALGTGDVWAHSAAFLELWGVLRFNLVYHRAGLRRYVDQLIREVAAAERSS